MLNTGLECVQYNTRKQYKGLYSGPEPGAVHLYRLRNSS